MGFAQAWCGELVQGRAEEPVGVRGRSPEPLLGELGQRGGGGLLWTRAASVSCLGQNEPMGPQVLA